MESSRPSRLEKDSERHRRSPSSSRDSEEEKRQRRRKKEREVAERDSTRSNRPDRDSRDAYDGRDSKRRRSRSPRPESSRRRHEEHSSRPRTTRDRSPSSRDRRHDRDSRHPSTRDRSPYRSTKDRDVRGSREASATQVSRKSKGPLPSQSASFQANEDPSKALVLAGQEADKQKPSLAPTGLLAAATKTIAQADGTQIVLKYHEPPEARKPPPEDQWKLFVFKGADILETIELSTRSCWLIGRELSVVDLPAEHPSVSKQHAAIQFRHLEKKNEYGDKIGKVKPYLIDLGSANGTLLNKEELPATRYLELRDKDMIQFGSSTREYVLMLSPKE